jgi:hypothetical protein
MARRGGAGRILLAVVLLGLVLMSRKRLMGVVGVDAGESGTSSDVAEPGSVRTMPSGGGDVSPGTLEALEQARQVVRKAEVEGDKEVQLVCDLEPPIKDGYGALEIGGHSDMIGRSVQVFDGRVYIPYVYAKPRPDGKPVTPFPREGWLAINGYGPVKIAWEEQPPAPQEGGNVQRASCVVPGTSERAKVPIAPGVAAVTGTVSSSASMGRVKGAWVEGCGNRVLIEDDGSFYMEIVPEPCTLRAMRQPGKVRAKSPPVEIIPTPGKDLVVDLVISG